jgi:hypothetical protein
VLATKTLMYRNRSLTISDFANKVQITNQETWRYFLAVGGDLRVDHPADLVTKPDRASAAAAAGAGGH